MNIGFQQFGEIFEYPDNAYVLVGDSKKGATYKIKANTDTFKYKEVNVTSAEILTVGATPKELLPALGASKYYDWYAYVEYNFGTIAYSMASGFSMQQGTVNKIPFGTLGINTQNAVAIVRPIPGSNTGFGFLPNQPLLLGTLTNADPTNGDGTLRIKLYYKIKTFGK